jgi:PPOX class probable F420-dependent enzyme
MAGKVPLISAAVRTRLDAARVARLATLDARQGPHLIPICFAHDGAVFYSAIDRKPKRVTPNRLARMQNIKRTPQVALLVDEYNEDWTRLWYVLVRGKAALVSTAEERTRALELLRAKYSQYAAGMLADDAPVIRITPQRVITWGNL